jgi:hypothetical protein
MSQLAPAAPRDRGADLDRQRITFEVHRETVQLGDDRITVALQLWLWAIVPRAAGSLPGQPGCEAAVAALRAAAQAAIGIARLTPPPDVEPFRWRLYASRRMPEADELRLELTLRAAPAGAAPGGAGPEQAARERALLSLRRALEEVGVLEG